MGDLLFVAIVVAFFAIAALFAKACDTIIGPDHELDRDVVVEASR